MSIEFSTELNRERNDLKNQNQHLIFSKYKNPDIPNHEDSVHFYIEDILFTKYWNRIDSTKIFVTLTAEQRAKINFRPELASFELLGIKGYGDIIMKMNNCRSFMDFRDFNSLYIPSLNIITTVIQEEIFMQNNN